MDTPQTSSGAQRLLEPAAIEKLISALAGRGYTVIGPVVRDGAITYEEVRSAADLPAGWGAEQAAGRFRLVQRDDGALFGYGVGPRSPKKYLHPSEICLFKAESANGEFRVLNDRPPAPKYAFLGVRPCELAAIAAQDRVLLGDRFSDSIYRERRAQAFLVAVNCTEPGGTCFCASMGTGQAAAGGYDSLLTELVEPGRHVLVAQAGTPAGEELLDELGAEEAPAGVRQSAAAAVQAAGARMGRTVDTSGLQQALCDAFENPRFDLAAARCMSCGNCTLVCPTCFCVTVEDTSDVTVTKAERWRRWDSCFTQSFSYIHGGSVRQSPKSRYRQWLTHKFSSWVDQFGTPGCVGCGRCITWCPVGIDVTEELAAIHGA
ncbi:MAG: 4Fe-4S dicluster domain-containing protein [Acidobacteria bacterium]|nr:4Fe-4S dicluster domain-containing protein [Acidobacteriota bacterium]